MFNLKSFKRLINLKRYFRIPIVTSFLVFYMILTSIPLSNNSKLNISPYCLGGPKCKSDCSCTISPKCKLLDMDESIRNSILFYHNQIRDIQSYSQPSPAGLSLLHYDMELEQISLCWAALCKAEYSDCFMTSRFGQTSQAVVQLVLPPKQEATVFLWMQVWNNYIMEIKSLTLEMIQNLPSSKDGKSTLNYAHIISDRILSVGCAWSKSDNILTLVCTYGPRGATIGEAIYKPGPVCSMCPGGYSCSNEQPFVQLCKLTYYSTVDQEVVTSAAPIPVRPSLPFPYEGLPVTPDYPQIRDLAIPPPPVEMYSTGKEYNPKDNFRSGDMSSFGSMTSANDKSDSEFQIKVPKQLLVTRSYKHLAQVATEFIPGHVTPNPKSDVKSSHETIRSKSNILLLTFLILIFNVFGMMD